MIFYWQPINSTANFLRGILWCGFGNNFLYGIERVVLLTGLYLDLKRHTRTFLCIVCLILCFMRGFSCFFAEHVLRKIHHCTFPRKISRRPFLGLYPKNLHIFSLKNSDDLFFFFSSPFFTIFTLYFFYNHRPS